MPLKCLGVIPARYASQRAPGKPLVDLVGKSLVQRVWEQASQAKCVSELVIATEDKRIFDCAVSFGAKVLMTSDKHLTGSDRVSEACDLMAAQGKHFELVANIQGDMPFVNPKVIDGTISALAEASDNFGMSTVATPIHSEGEYYKPSAVKVVLGTLNQALYFSRSPIPYIRNEDDLYSSDPPSYGHKHMGLYVFRPSVLKRISSLSQSLPERREQLEQLRALCNGINIKVYIAARSDVEPAIEVDTPDDIQAAIAYIMGMSK